MADHRRHPPAAAVTGRAGPLAALSLFTVLPVPRRDTAPGPRVVLWMPPVGAVLGVLGALPALLVWHGPGHGSPLLAAALLEAAVALLTRGLHLDGLADLADGLGSRRPPEQARAIMRRSDIGPFGVLALLLVLLVRVTALAAVLSSAGPAAGLAAVLTALVTGRIAVVAAAGEPASPGSSFGALVAGGTGRAARLAWLCAGPLLGAAGRLLTGGGPAGAGWTAAAVCGALAVAAVLRRHAVRRLGGVSGDIFGALVETATTVVLVVLAGEHAWR
ncbi:adenosylcobinamide-GDP ribazoletransferase [Streptantibioticus silvisoli]|uniref:Adenosylcobinamide-GDP ribazoletransferase n=1 Tax=Streptantibioticus silvisoli TaxID=2705255 RepID=A0ABT6W7A1_9ACTN|nr:adenosylcobinamide-GDP ribazoletransferase [Streptantibioticus silvisoli]MDI5966613.1 adenosylcobinamide-GDP ribazoletransferase [Streptantibioticus silvisoli]